MAGNRDEDIREKARVQRERRAAVCRQKFGAAEPPAEAPCQYCRRPAADHLLPNFDCPAGGVGRMQLGEMP